MKLRVDGAAAATSRSDPESAPRGESLTGPGRPGFVWEFGVWFSGRLGVSNEGLTAVGFWNKLLIPRAPCMYVHACMSVYLYVYTIDLFWGLHYINRTYFGPFGLHRTFPSSKYLGARN